MLLYTALKVITVLKKQPQINRNLKVEQVTILVQKQQLQSHILNR